MNTHASPPAPGSSPARNHLLAQWEAADQCVPFPFLLYWVARPPAGRAESTLSRLTHMDFVYGTTTDFIVLLSSREGVFTPAIVERAPRNNSEFKFIPLMGLQQIRLTPDQAELAIEAHLRHQDHAFWEWFLVQSDETVPHAPKREVERLLARYRQLPWHSVKLEHPRSAGITEPSYRFRRAHARYEFQVGARTGQVIRHDIREPIAPPPFVPPPAP